MARTDPPDTVVCEFYERVPADAQDSYYFDRIWLSSPEADGDLLTPWPPAVGDTVFLYDRGGTETGPRGLFRVVERDWRHASFLSTYWSALDKHPSVGPRLTLIVVKVADGGGPFRGQVSREGRDD